MRSCGLLLYRTRTEPELWLGHMGGPFWGDKQEASWSIPKGIPDPGESDLAAAVREFTEEIGTAPPAQLLEHGHDIELLGEFRQSSGKVVVIFTASIDGIPDADAAITFAGSNEFEMEWPPRSGRLRSFPEIDRAEWVGLTRARTLLVKGQVAAVDALERRLVG